jgi:aldose 1-epimerase
MAVAPSGQQFEIVGGGYRAVVTECGAGLRVLEHDGRPLIDGYAEDEQATAGRGQLLLPWPNRIRDGRYRFEDSDLQLPLSEPSRGNASHGLTRWTAWSVREHTGEAVTLGYRLMSQAGYPWTLDLTASYAVSAAGLDVAVSATNRSGSPAPLATGAHPYLRVGDPPADTWTLTLPGSTALAVDDRMIPTGSVEVEGTDLDFRAGRVIGDVRLDTAYGDLARDQDGWAEVRLTGPDGGVGLRMDGHHRWVQAFVGPPGRRDAVAVEPMTSPPNAFATGDDLIVLEPDETVTVRWGVHAW